MAAISSPAITTNGLVFSYDMYNTKSFVGAPTTNFAYQRNIRSDLTYASYVYTTSGTWQAKHPDAIRVYDNDSGTEISGNVNTGVGDWTNTYHGVYNYDTELKRPVFIMRNYDSNWKANSFGLNVSTFAAMGLTNGSTYTISWLQWVDNLNACADAGMYSPNTSGTYSFWDGLASSRPTAYNTLLNTWQRVYATFTVNAVVNVNGGLGGIYMYGMNTVANCVIKVVDVQVEVGSVPSSYSRNQTRSNTQAIIDLTGTTTVTANSLTYAAGNTFSFNGSSNYLSIANSPALLPTSEVTVSMWVKANAITSGWCRLLGQDPYSGGYLIFLESGGSLIRALHYVNGVEYRCGTNEPISTTEYKHIVFTFKTGDAIRSYFNGVASTTVALPAGTFTYNASNPFLVGYTGGSWFNGIVSNIQIYNRVLSATEVQQNFDALRGRYGL